MTLPSRVGSMANVSALAGLADAAGFDAQWSYEVFRNPLLVTAAAAMSTRVSRVGTGIVAALSRSPFDLANSAADLDDLSGGRMMLGIGTGAPEALRAFHSTHGESPIPRMREYLDVLRRSWEYLATGTAQPFEGEHFSFRPPPINPWGAREMVRAQIPVYLAAMRPHMLRLCGSRADGWIGYFYTPELLDSHVRPHLAQGAAKAGRGDVDIEVCVEMVCSISPDRELAMMRARRQVGFYAVHPITDSLLTQYGLIDDVWELRKRFRAQGVDAFAHTSDRLVETLSVTGTPDEARQKLAAYRGHVDLMMLHTPYVPPLTVDDATDAFSNIVTTFAPGRVDGAC
ncbi:LLM class flavin-dependent oxidoreductase [Mycobacterium kiyosense]|uniref:LLM class flavin-dependent oxidoreductase n=1 Tax=Mycobacterium kiyosense TaxID=2871094 RepID=UPI001F41BD9F|nr:LLM class flavin-dependent oxidoreductase [Mycobacterium kiyosense]